MTFRKLFAFFVVAVPGLATAIIFANAAGSTSPAALPAIEYIQKCELAGQFVGLQSKDEEAGRAATKLCVTDEKRAQDWLVAQWKGLEHSLKRECLDHVQKTHKALEYSWIMSCIVNRLDP